MCVTVYRILIETLDFLIREAMHTLKQVQFGNTFRFLDALTIHHAVWNIQINLNNFICMNTLYFKYVMALKMNSKYVRGIHNVSMSKAHATLYHKKPLSDA